MLVVRKFSTCPGLQVKYSGAPAGISTALLFAVMTAVLPIVAQTDKFV